MGFVLQVLTANPPADPKLRDGALYMVGSLAEILLKKDMYKEQLDKMLCQYVFPEFQSPQGHMRARACWVLNMFNEVQFKQEAVLQEAVRLTTTCLLADQELPVKVEAAVALQMLISNQDCVQGLIEPQIKPIVLELLKIIRETENDDLTNVMQKIVCSFAEQLAPIAVEICEHLKRQKPMKSKAHPLSPLYFFAATFLRVLETDEGSDEKAITAMGLLNTMETLLTVMEDLPEIVAQLQPIVLQVISHVFAQSVMEFYEEALSLVYDLTRKSISPHLWQVLEMMYTLFERDGFDYFTDMMPALHNYVTVDTEAFLASESRVLVVWNMCRAVLTGDAGEDPECHAAKLLEVLILQCKGRIDTEFTKPIFNFEKPSGFLYKFLKIECGALVMSRVLCCCWLERGELVTSLSQRTQTLKIYTKKKHHKLNFKNRLTALKFKGPENRQLKLKFHEIQCFIIEKFNLRPKFDLIENKIKLTI
ncbi:hypothetical protein B566_EDAN017735 [Ephemera danica]|nr:hypothetical protein B566_EDAN017735 [Ephemera danica]